MSHERTTGENTERESERAQGGAYPAEVDNRRAPPHDGEPPRPASEPAGSEGRARPDPERSSDRETARETLTDPSTGEPLKPSAPGEQGWSPEGGGGGPR